VSTLAYALGLSACPIALYCGDLRSAERFIRIQLDGLAHQQAPKWEAWARCFEGVLLIKRGESKSGAAKLARALSELPPNAFHLRHIAFFFDLAQAFADDQQIERAATTIEEALDVTRRHEQFWCMPELLRVRGEIAEKNGATQEAETYIHECLDWSRRQKAPSWELRGATSLARLWLEKGRAEEAFQVLNSAYKRFTEGFETNDLQKARSFLDQLSGTEHGAAPHRGEGDSVRTPSTRA
jgi:ATP/maltotriose-dependent transcriptional regulator MalT